MIPLFLAQVLDRLPIKLEHLTTTKIGKAVKKISNSHSNEGSSFSFSPRRT